MLSAAPGAADVWIPPGELDREGRSAQPFVEGRERGADDLDVGRIEPVPRALVRVPDEADEVGAHVSDSHPLHVGHVKLIRHATAYGLVIVALNSTEWLMRKKGYIFMPWEERRDILLALEDVYRVYKVVDTDDTVAEALRKVNPDFFCNGGDRTEGDPREKDVCEDLKITQIFKAGGDKIQSSD